MVGDGWAEGGRTQAPRQSPPPSQAHPFVVANPRPRPLRRLRGRRRRERVGVRRGGLCRGELRGWGAARAAVVARGSAADAGLSVL